MYIFGMPTIPRALTRVVVARRNNPVLVVEGARAVGKTTLMRDQLVAAYGYSYVDLSDQAVRADAEHDLAGWLRRLPDPVVIDEAQLVPDLPVEVKRLVDIETRTFVLTGSASIGRNTLGGADALAGRATRIRLSPMTKWEVDRHVGSLVDLLFGTVPKIGWRSSRSEDDLVQDLTVGGFPRFSSPTGLITARDRRRDIEAYVDGVLGSSVLPDRGRDGMVARTIFHSLVCNPGAVLNASKLGATVDLDRRTIDRYVGMFEQLFLTQALPNLALAASKQSHARSKIHPADTAIAVALNERAGGDLRSDREFLGALLESHVVNQVLPARAWASTATDAFFWRKSTDRSPEVDLVLVDGSGRTVGIEVKLASTVSGSDARGLRALRDARGLHAGYIVYCGPDVRQLDEDIWAIPIEAVTTPRAWSDSALVPGAPEVPITPTPEGSPMVVESPARDFDATLFVSYVHADNEHARGRILQFARDVQATYSALYGFEVKLFIDRADILWGEQWRARLEREINETTFVMSFVTPRYLTSDACRSEVLSFSAAARSAGDVRLLLPLQWIDTHTSDIVDSEDPVRRALEESQYIDVTSIRRADPSSQAWDDMVEAVVERLRATIVARRTDRNPAPAATTDSGGEDLVVHLVKLEAGQTALSATVARFQDRLETLSSAMARYQAPPSQSPAALQSSFHDLGTDLAPDIASLEEATADLGEEWDGFNTSVQAFLTIANQVPELRAPLRESLAAIAELPELPEAESMRQTLLAFGMISADLRPLSRAISSAILLYSGTREAATGWLNQV